MDPTSPASRIPRSRKHSTVEYLTSADWPSARREFSTVRVKLRVEGGREVLKGARSN